MSGRAASAGLAALGALGLAGAAGGQDLSFSQVERGRYLATAANCVGCHTDFDNDGTPFVGGRAMETPFGVIYTPNLTPDEETGLGRWTRDDFENALRRGVGRDGEQLYPAFPYPYFTLMSRQDTDAIFEYLRTLEPVRSETPDPEFPFPLNVRAAVMGWDFLHFEEGEFVDDPEQSDEWNRGRFLVDGPAHCGACHTGKNMLGADIEDEYLRGGVLEDWHAPNIRGGDHGGLDHWSQADIVEFLRDGRNAHTAAMSRMGEVVVLSTQNLLEEDLEAIAVYLKSLGDEPGPGAGVIDEETAAIGHAIYFDNCAACHATDGSGVPYIFAPLDGSNKVNSADPTTLIRIVLQGAQAIPTNAHPGPLGMPAFDWKLNDEQVADLLTYVRGAWSNSAPPVSASDVADIRASLEED